MRELGKKFWREKFLICRSLLILSRLWIYGEYVPFQYWVLDAITLGWRPNTSRLYLLLLTIYSFMVTVVKLRSQCLRYVHFLFWFGTNVRYVKRRRVKIVVHLGFVRMMTFIGKWKEKESVFSRSGFIQIA